MQQKTTDYCWLIQIQVSHSIYSLNDLELSKYLTKFLFQF